MPTRHAPFIIKQFAAPPPIFRRSSNSNNIVRLKIEFLRYRRRIIIQRAHVEKHTPSVLSVLLRWGLRERLWRRLRKRHRLRRWRPVHRAGTDGPEPAAAAAVGHMLMLNLVLMLMLLLILLRRWLLLLLLGLLRRVSLLLSIILPTAARGRCSALLLLLSLLLLLLLLKRLLHAIGHLWRVVYL